jgi:D-glucuronyl C5-epimerase C-terminus
LATPEGLVLEEVPFRVPNTILNSWISALYGLYELTLVDDSQDARDALESTQNALLGFLPKCDTGFWFFYDTSGALAGLFYHRFHIAQLKALEPSYPERAERLRKARERFQSQLVSHLRVAKATALAAGYQTLRPTPELLTRS